MEALLESLFIVVCGLAAASVLGSRGKSGGINHPPTNRRPPPPPAPPQRH